MFLFKLTDQIFVYFIHTKTSKIWLPPAITKNHCRHPLLDQTWRDNCARADLIVLRRSIRSYQIFHEFFTKIEIYFWYSFHTMCQLFTSLLHRAVRPICPIYLYHKCMSYLSQHLLSTMSSSWLSVSLDTQMMYLAFPRQQEIIY